MLSLHALSPVNELALVERLASDIRRVWPDAVADPDDRIDLLVGARRGVEVDLLIALDLATPRAVPPLQHANAPSAGAVRSGLIAVEIKQLDATCFERIGDQLYAKYNGRRNRRSVVDQARDAAFGIKAFAEASGYPDLYVHALAWLTQFDRAALADVDPAVVGAADWGTLLTSACAQNASLCRTDERTRKGVGAVRDRLLNRRIPTSLDRRKVEAIARDTLIRELVDELAPLAGRATIRLAGHGGSGKTTALVLLATRLATRHDARVLVLTFHHALCGDIRHVLASLPDAQSVIGDVIQVETATSFLLDLVAAAGGTVPHTPDGTIDYDRTDAVYREVADVLGAYAFDDGSNARAVVAEDCARFDWDHVLIDESQDWTDAERDLLRAVYGSRRLVLADGLVQLIRRQTSCNWMRDVPKAERVVRMLGASLRMQHNVALFVNAVAKTIGFADWSVEPKIELSGGRVVVIEGELPDEVALVRVLGDAAALGKADPVDNLICVPHCDIVRGREGARHARLADELVAAGHQVWDACDPLTRTGVPQNVAAWRVIQYDSCRGLEGWMTLLIGLDDLYANRLKHPNIGSTDTLANPEMVARRWLLIPLTRAVHLLVIHVRDPRSRVADMLREAIRLMPKGVVETHAAGDAVAALRGFGAR